MPLQQTGAQLGDELLVCVDESELLRAGLFAYLLPARVGRKSGFIAPSAECLAFGG